MTSNLGSEAILELGVRGTFGFGERKDEAVTEDHMRARVNELLRERFKPEFLNRVDESIIFHSLRDHDLAQIVDLQLRKVTERLARKKIVLLVTDAARLLIAKQGYDPVFGARPLRRLIQNKILDPLAMKIVQGEIEEGSEVEVQADADIIAFSIKIPERVKS